MIVEEALHALDRYRLLGRELEVEFARGDRKSKLRLFLCVVADAARNRFLFQHPRKCDHERRRHATDAAAVAVVVVVAAAAVVVAVNSAAEIVHAGNFDETTRSVDASFSSSRDRRQRSGSPVARDRRRGAASRSRSPHSRSPVARR